MFKLSFSEYIKILIIFFVLFIILLITFIKYDSNFKTEYTLENHYKIEEIISKNLNQCNTDKIDLNKKFIVDKSLICKLEINNDNFINLTEIFVNLFKIHNICNVYKNDINKKCLPAVLFRNDIEQTLIGESSLSIIDNRLHIHTKINSNENVTNIINLN